MTPANWLTLLRIVLIPVFIIMLLYNHFMAALMAFLAAAITDVLDGLVARRTKTSTLGAFLDPTADKLMLVSAYIVLPSTTALPVWVSVLVVSRDVIIALGYLIIYLNWKITKLEVRSLGKASTFVQSFGVGFFILAELMPSLHPLLPAMAWLVGGVTVASGLDYILLGIRFTNTLPRGKRNGSPAES